MESARVGAPATDHRDELLKAVDRYEPFGETPSPYALEQVGGTYYDVNSAAEIESQLIRVAQRGPAVHPGR